MFEVDSGFIGDFKTGDNINFNLHCLVALYAAQKSMDPSISVLLCKPITITLASIVEALLHDLFFRMKSFTTEGVNNIAEKVLSDVQKKTLDKLETYSITLLSLGINICTQPPCPSSYRIKCKR
jgi:hypothetical protein